MNIDKVTRLEVIDHTTPDGGRRYVYGPCSAASMTLSLQDDGRTLKVFIEKTEPPTDRSQI